MKPLNFAPQNVKSRSLETDLLALAALIRERESSLIMLLEEKRQKDWERPQWLLKECEYQQKEIRLSREIRRIILNYVLLNNQQNEGEEYFKTIRGFWLKIKIIMKMSLEQVKVLNILNYALFQRYESIIDQINCGYDQAIGIVHYRNIEDMIKNRNRQIHQLLNQKPISQIPQILRNRSEYLMKSLKKQGQTCMRSSKLLSLTKRRGDLPDLDWKFIKRPLSHQNKQKRPIRSKQMQKPKFIKKLNHTLDNLEQKLYDIMEMKIDTKIDKTKSLKINMEVLHNQLLDRNASKQKDITKFILSHSGKLIRKMKPKKVMKLKSKTKKNDESPSPALRKVIKSKQVVKNRGLTLGKLKKAISKIGQKATIRPEICFGKLHKLL